MLNRRETLQRMTRFGGRPSWWSALALSVTLLGAVACGDDDDDQVPAAPDQPAGALFALTNRFDNSERLRAEGQDVLPATEAGNEVVVFARMDDGSLERVGAFPTGGIGANIRNSGANPLASQDPLIVTDDRRFVFAVNAGSDSITSFRVESDLSLTVAETVSTAGATNAARPVSLTYRNNVLYVLNSGVFVDGDGEELDFVPAGSAPERRRQRSGIIGFFVEADGRLSSIPGSELTVNTSTSGDGALAANGGSIEFSADGNSLYITERRTNNIVTVRLNGDGTPALSNGTPEMSTIASTTPQPFGTDIITTPDGVEVLVVSQGNNGVEGLSTLSSYTIGSDGVLRPASLSFGTQDDPFVTGFTFGCWVETVLGSNGLVYAYTANTPDGTLTGYRVDNADGTLTRLEQPDANGDIPATANVGGAGVLDTEIAGGYLYQVVSVGDPEDATNNARIAVFGINDGGALTRQAALDTEDPLFVTGQFVGVAGY